METIKLKGNECVPRNYTGIAEYESGIKYRYKDGNFHRIDGPACEYRKYKYWYIDDIMYYPFMLNELIKDSLFLKIEKGKYDLDWLKFLTENEGIKEFPIVPGMEQYKNFEILFAFLKQV